MYVRICTYITFWEFATFSYTVKVLITFSFLGDFPIPPFGKTSGNRLFYLREEYESPPKNKSTHTFTTHYASKM